MIKNYTLVFCAMLMSLSALANIPVGRYGGGTGTGTFDRKTNLYWEGSGGPVTHAQAAAVCQSMGSGYRLPTMKELMTIVDHYQTNIAPTVETTVPAFASTPFDGKYWTATTDASWRPMYMVRPMVWIVEFNRGTSRIVGDEVPGILFRCVRSG